MNITWYGLTCFRLEGAGSISIVTDPYSPEVGLTLPNRRADVVTVSRPGPSSGYTAGVRGPFKLLDGPGEYEISGVFITSIATFADDERGALRGLNTVFSFDFDGLTVCHLGRLGHVPTQSHVKGLGSVNVLLVPVGGGGSLTPFQASEVIGLFEPDVVVPAHYGIPGLKADLGSLEHFLKEMGVDKPDGRRTLTVRESDLSGETQVMVLEPAGR